MSSFLYCVAYSTPVTAITRRNGLEAVLRLLQVVIHGLGTKAMMAVSSQQWTAVYRFNESPSKTDRKMAGANGGLFESHRVTLQGMCQKDSETNCNLQPVGPLC